MRSLTNPLFEEELEVDDVQLRFILDEELVGSSNEINLTLD